MKINLSTVPYFSQNKRYDIKRYPNLSPLKYDTISFGSMKKHEFHDIDLLVVNKFKPPIEKFQTNEDFQEWCLNKINSKYMNKKYHGRHSDVVLHRDKVLDDWYKYCLKGNNNYKNSVLLLIIDSITSGLKEDNDVLPSALNKGVLAETIMEIKNNAEEHKHYQTDFDKLYEKNLLKHYLKDFQPEENIENKTGWITIPSSIKDPVNFYKNVNKLRALSINTWCTKAYNAESVLLSGDFHIYIEKGMPKVGIRYIDDEIFEIQGHKNDNTVPAEYLDVILERIKKQRINPYWKIQLNDAINLKGCN